MDEIKNANEIVRKMFEDAEKKTLSKMPMWMRYNYILNQINAVFLKGLTEDDLDWDYINKKLYTDITPYDNNMYSEVHTVTELQEARAQCLEASIINSAWRKAVCKDCKKEFILNYSECMFYERKELNLPKRCKCCRDKRKAGGNT